MSTHGELKLALDFRCPSCGFGNLLCTDSLLKIWANLYQTYRNVFFIVHYQTCSYHWAPLHEMDNRAKNRKKVKWHLLSNHRAYFNQTSSSSQQCDSYGISSATAESISIKVQRINFDRFLPKLLQSLRSASHQSCQAKNRKILTASSR